MKKNIVVTDVDGNQIGTTYPKRARGLIKNGRAEYVSDREIRLKNTRAPAVYTYTEDAKMSKVIDFNTRNFKFEDTCKSNVGFRGFVSTALGNEEIWEIGDWGWNWTQICTELTGLDKNTDYVFRFAMTLGHNDDNQEESLVHIFRSYPDATLESVNSQSTSEDVPDKCLEFIHQSPNAEIAIHVLETGILSGNDVKNICDNSSNPDEAVKKICDEFRIRMVDHHSKPVSDINIQADIEEKRKKAWEDRYTYCIKQSRFKPVISKRDKDEDTMLRIFELPFNTEDSENWKIVIVSNHAIARFFKAREPQAYSELEDLSYEQWRKQRTAKLIAKEEQCINQSLNLSLGKRINQQINESLNQDLKIDGSMFQRSDGAMTEKEFASFLAGCEDGGTCCFTDFTVSPDIDGKLSIDIGRALDGWTISFTDVTMTALAFSMIIAKIGDGSTLMMADVTVTDQGLENVSSLSGIKPDGFVAKFKDTVIPRRLIELLNERKGDGCMISLNDTQLTD